MRIRTVQIDDDVATVLKAAKLEGNNLYLQGQLSRPMYEKVNKVLSLIGFKWTSGKVKAHVGQGDSMAKLKEALGSGTVVDEKKTYQFFETPARLAGRMASLAEIRSEHRVLEPSAGKGAILRAIAQSGSCPAVVDVCEINPSMIEGLKANNGACLVGTDFLALKGRSYDRIVMNPPFTAGQDIDHVLHAYELLNPGGRLVAITSRSWQSNTQRKYRWFREWYSKLQHEEGFASIPEELPPGTFGESGTEVGTLLLIIMKPKALEKDEERAA